MPVKCSKDSEGSYCRWGGHGKKYYYINGNERSKMMAYNKAKRQGMAIHASGWKGK